MSSYTVQISPPFSILNLLAISTSEHTADKMTISIIGVISVSLSELMDKLYYDMCKQSKLFQRLFLQRKHKQLEKWLPFLVSNIEQTQTISRSYCQHQHNV